MTVKDVRPLPYLGEPTPEDWGKVREAKRNTNLDFMVKPIRASWDHWRVLAFGTKPAMICDYALATPNTTISGYQAILNWLYGVTDDPRPTTAAQMLSRVFSAPVKEIDESQIRKEKFQRLPFSVRFKLDQD